MDVLAKRGGKLAGTREWAPGGTVNCLVGCSHDCRYCYARAMALRFGRIKSAAEWSRPKVAGGSPSASLRRVCDFAQRSGPGMVMFPSTHDILPEFLNLCLGTLETLLEAGKQVLVVTKPHFDCVRAIGERLGQFRKQILFRMTIGAMDEKLLAYWEPGAPTFQERMYALALARRFRFETSVSCEPLLEAERPLELVRELEPYVTETIWIGKMNRIRQRCIEGTSEEAIRRIEAGQTDKRVWEIYAQLKDHPKIRWKDSYRAILDQVAVEPTR